MQCAQCSVQIALHHGIVRAVSLSKTWKRSLHYELQSENSSTPYLINVFLSSALPRYSDTFAENLHITSKFSSFSQTSSSPAHKEGVPRFRTTAKVSGQPTRATFAENSYSAIQIVQSSVNSCVLTLLHRNSFSAN